MVDTSSSREPRRKLLQRNIAPAKIPEGIWIVVITATAYGYTFLYELGKAAHYDLPYWTVGVTVSDLAEVGILVVPIVVLVTVVLPKLGSPGMTGSLLGQFGIMALVLIATNTLRRGYGPPRGNLLLGLLLLAALIALVLFLRPLARLRRWFLRDSSDAPLIDFHRAYPYLNYIWILYTGGMIMYSLGLLSATFRSSFTIMEGRSCIVVSNRDGTLACADYIRDSPRHASLTGSFQLLSNEVVSQEKLVHESLGRVASPP